MEREAKEALILRLFRAYPGGENKVSRETVNIYLKAVEWFDVPLVSEAVERFATGQVDRKSRAFVPSADELATEIRTVRYNQGVGSRLLSQGRKQLEQRDRDAEIEATRTPESMARVKSMAQAFAQSVNPDKRTDAEIAQIKESTRKADVYFAEDYIDPAGVRVSQTLAKKLGYETFNSADDDARDMGEIR